MKTRLAQLLSTGFSDWSSNEYSRFIKAFKKLDLGDIEGIALEVETKSHDEV
jgi:SWI/SNF-related matrix-associated actin-dependent regulator of chromatin subfamily A member 5